MLDLGFLQELDFKKVLLVPAVIFILIIAFFLWQKSSEAAQINEINFSEPVPIEGIQQLKVTVENGQLQNLDFIESYMPKANGNSLSIENLHSREHQFLVNHFMYDSFDPVSLFSGKIGAGESKEVALPFREYDYYFYRCLDCKMTEANYNAGTIFAFSSPERIVDIEFSEKGFKVPEISLKIERPSMLSQGDDPVRLFRVKNTSSSKVLLAFLSNYPNAESKFGFRPYADFYAATGQTRMFRLFFLTPVATYSFICDEGCPENSRNLNVVIIN